MVQTSRSFAIFFVAKMLMVHTTCGNTVDQLLIQLRNMSSSFDLHDIERYVEEFEQRYLLGDQRLEVRKQESFWLYTRNNPDSRQTLKINDPISILDSYFSGDRKTVVLVHGWLNAGNATFLQVLKNLYLKHHDYNIICVDWSEMASNLVYPLARYGIKYIGYQIATMLATLVRVTGYTWTDFHLVGHSLGAHVCGIAGEYIKYEKIGRITGLDPARPLFGPDPDGRLDPTDAQFVDIIHTCGGYLGYSEPCGHVDFYPNGGMYHQPGCGIEIGSCSHTRSYIYFAESLSTETGFYARPCKSWESYQAGSCNCTASCNGTLVVNSTDPGEFIQGLVLMGEYVNTSARGNFYLMTASSKPFALGRYCPPKPEDIPVHSSSSRNLPTTWIDRCKRFLDTLIAVKVKAFGTWGLLTSNVYSMFS